MTVRLPDEGDGSRRQRRQVSRKRDRRPIRRIVATLAAVAAMAGLAWFGVGLLDDDPGAPPAAVEEGTTAVDGPGPALVVLVDDAGDVYGLTILVPATSTIVHVPPGTLVEIPSLGLASLGDAAADGGDELLRQSLENLLGARFEEVLRLDPADLAAAVADAGPLPVVLDDAVEERVAGGRVTVVVPSGPLTVGPDNVVALLRSVGDGTALDRLVRHQLFWTAYLAAVGDDAPIDAIGALAGADVRQRVLPVEAVAGLDGDDELYRVVSDDLDELVQRVLPAAARPDGSRVRVRILNGAGAPGVAQDAQPLLVDMGAEVTLSGNADRFDYATTQVVYYDDEHLDDARAVAEALGVGEVVKSLNELAVVDVTVVVGADFLAAHPAAQTEDSLRPYPGDS